MYQKELLPARSSYHKRAKIPCFSLRSSSFSRFFRYITLISLSFLLFATYYLKQQTILQISNENTLHTSFEDINFKDTGVLKGHTYIELLHLNSTWNSTSYHDVPVTIVIIHDNKDNHIGKQLNAIASQSIKPKSILIITTSENVNRILQVKISAKNLEIHVINNNNDIKPFTYLQIIQQKAQTKYVLLLNSGAILGEQYLQNMLHISHTEEYNNSILGTMGINFNGVPNRVQDLSLTCYEDHLVSSENNVARISKDVDMLTNIWFLKRKWLPIMLKEARRDIIDLPLEFLISFSLLYHVNIPSILIPTLDQQSWGDTRSKSIHCKKLRRKFINDDAWLRYIERGYPLITKEPSLRKENSILFLIDGSNQERYFRQLYCQLSLVNNNLVKIITTGENFGLSGSRLKRIIKKEGSSCGRIEVYDLDLEIQNDFNVKSQIYQNVLRMTEYLKPELLIYAKVTTKNLLMKGISSAIEGFNGDISIINLPLEEIAHIIGLMIDLPFEALKKWNEPIIQLQIITQNRPDSLSRLVNSLNSSYYFGDENIHLTVNIDRGADPVTLEYCSTFSWNHGKKTVRHRVVQGGLLPAVVESYYPYNYHDYAVILEDDIEVSPFFYLWIKYNLLKYRYGPDKNHSQRLYGISLYGQRQMELNMIGRKPYDPESKFNGTSFPIRSPYLSQIPCSWGAIYFPEVWREFHDYLAERLDDDTKYHLQPIKVPESRSYKWKKSWKRYFIELVYLRGYVMLYPNFKNFTSFSTNHAEIGTHIQFRKNKPAYSTVFGVPLMMENTIYKELPDNHLTDFNQLPVTDLWGNLTSFHELIDRGITLHNEVSLCPPHFRREFDQLNFSPKDILCVDDERKRKAIRDYKAFEKSQGKGSSMPKTTEV